MSETGTATADRPPGRDGKPARRGRRAGLLSRLSLYVKQVVAELRKVIWPTRRELITYTAVVLIFVIFMIAVIGALDFVFTKGVLAVFG